MCDLLRGRELDAAITEEVMGWTDVESMPLGWGRKSAIWTGLNPQRRSPGVAETVPRYHADDNACMEVVREMQSRGYSLAIYLTAVARCHIFPPGMTEGHMAAGWAVTDQDDRVAILNAALRAVRKEQGG